MMTIIVTNKSAHIAKVTSDIKTTMQWMCFMICFTRRHSETWTPTSTGG